MNQVIDLRQHLAAGTATPVTSTPVAARTEPRPASAARAFAEQRARTLPRYRLWDGAGQYLRLDGEGLTTNLAHAWVGYATHAQAARRRFAAAKGLRPVRILKLAPAREQV